MSLQIKHIYEFGPFGLDPAEHLLLRSGEVVPLTPKAFDLLLALVEEHGHLLEKEELLKKVWPDTFVEEANLASNISQLRKVLGDRENGQRYIETAPKRGYRFVASVREVTQKRAEPAIQEFPGLQSTVAEGEQAANAGELITTHPAVKGESLTRKFKRYERGAFIALAALTLSGVGLAYFAFRPPLPPKVTAFLQITRDGSKKFWNSSFSSSLVTDGPRLYFSGEARLAQVSSTGGETVPIPASFTNPSIKDISPNRSELLVENRLQSEFDAPLWLLPVLGGAPRRLGNLQGHAGTWSLDGQQIVYANGTALYLAKTDGTELRKLVTVAGRPAWPRWAPDGSRLRFTVLDVNNSGLSSLWEVAADGSNLHALLPGWNDPAVECCGNWTPDGRYFVYQSTRNGTTNIWALREQTGYFRRASQEPVQLTFGPLNFYAPVPSQNGKMLFVVGEQRRGELARYDTKSQQWVSYLPGISADQLGFSNDGEWVAYVTYPEGSLWRSKVDGSQRLQLSYAPMQAGLPRWSPDGKEIVFVGRAQGKGWKTHLVSAEGESLRQLMPGERSELDPGWAPQGNSLVFWSGGVPPEPSAIYKLDLRTQQVSMVPGSEGLYSPRWSPDGRYIAANPVGHQNKLLIFDTTSQTWTELANQSAGWPHWSRDGKYIYFRSFGRGLFRVGIESHKIEQLAIPKDQLPGTGGVFGSWIGWDLNDSPLVLRDVGSQDIYALEWQTP
jgi:DNA-binding winged helix-turn-helix (wHTH) protein/Tol biopolymer transport system component